MDNRVQMFMMDALKPMMIVATKRNKEAQGFLGVYENLPLQDGSFCSAMGGFAIRDSKNLVTALSEVRRVLKQNGYFLIVDLSRPESKLKDLLVSAYWLVLAPFIAFVAAGRVGLKFGALYATYKRLPRKKQFVNLLWSMGFEVVDQRFRMMDGVCIILLRKK